MFPLRLMAIHAHPDDESSKGAATLAKYAAEGVAVMVVTCTGGERGGILNPEWMGEAPQGAYLREIRRREMAAAQEILGVEHQWLGFVDSGMPTGHLPVGCFAAMSLPVAARPLVALIRRFRPHVMTTYDESGGYPHPDHVMSHRIAAFSYKAAGDREQYPGLGDPWQPLKLYYSRAHSRARASALRRAMLRRGNQVPYIWTEGAPRQGKPEFTTRIPCGEWFDVRDRALKAHATQVDPRGFWFGVPNEVQRTCWPTEDFELARTSVETTLPEDDLFAGIRSQEILRRAG